MLDGEALVFIHEGRSNPHEIHLELLTAYRLDVEKNKLLPDGNVMRMGIEMGKRIRKPIAYWLNLPEDPLQGSYSFSPQIGSKFERVGAEKIIHMIIPERMEKSRGVPWRAPAMPHLKLFQTYLENEIVASSLSAAKVATMTNNSGEDYTGDGTTDVYTLLSNMDPGSVEQLPAGWEMKPLEFFHPTSQFLATLETVIQHIANRLSIPYSDLSGDMTGASYSSHRQEVLQSREYYRQVQKWFTDQFINLVFQRWLSSALTTPGDGVNPVLTLPVVKYEKWSKNSQWYPRGFVGVDSQKDATAKQIGLKNVFITLQDIAGDRGTDLGSLFFEHQQAKVLADQFGVKISFEPFGTPHKSVIPEEPETETSEE